MCGGLRLYHEKFGVPIESVPMAIPISLRTADDPAGGNRWSGAPLAPPVDEPDPAERIRRIRQQVLDARQEPAIDAMHVLAPVAARLPTWALAAVSGGGAAPDLQVSNVPGSTEPLYLAGAKVLKLLPFGPVPGPAAMITMNSYVNTCYVGINCDAAAITEPELFRTCLERGVDEVALRPRPAPRKHVAAQEGRATQEVSLTADVDPADEVGGDLVAVGLVQDLVAGAPVVAGLDVEAPVAELALQLAHVRACRMPGPARR